MSGHTHSNLLIHVIFSTKDRLPLTKESFRDRLYQYMAGVAKNEFGHAVRIGGTRNHVHALLSIKTTASVSETMRKLKSLSSGWIHKTMPNAQSFGWQSGYAAFTISQSNADSVARYITEQEQRHKQFSYENEFIELLKRHNVSYDPKYLWT